MFIFSKEKPKVFNAIKEPSVRKEGQKIHKRKLVENIKGSALAKGRSKGDKSISNVWDIPAGNNISTKDELAFQHPAIYPEELVKKHIYSWSNEGDLVYDPFMGSGTTAKMAHIYKRNWIGSELSQEYVDLANKRLKPYLDQQTLF
jgi:site-specific DNA-methyltransferase (adenine-specific)